MHILEVLKALSPRGKELQLDVLHLLSPVVDQSRPRPNHGIVNPSPIVRHDICPKFYTGPDFHAADDCCWHLGTEATHWAGGKDAEDEVWPKLLGSCLPYVAL